MWVVKLGGSLFDSQYLVEWLQALADSEHESVVVPGGGPFADQVRAAQSRWRFTDTVAHRMALTAMRQMGELMCGLHPDFVGCDSVAALQAAQSAKRIPVWFPEAMAGEAPDVPQDWSVTSDSLALWLARQLGADGVLLVKSAPLSDPAKPLADLQHDGLIDAAADRFIAALACPVLLVNRSDSARLDHVLDTLDRPAMRLVG